MIVLAEDILFDLHHAALAEPRGVAVDRVMGMGMRVIMEAIMKVVMIVVMIVVEVRVVVIRLRGQFLTIDTGFTLAAAAHSTHLFNL